MKISEFREIVRSSILEICLTRQSPPIFNVFAHAQCDVNDGSVAFLAETYGHGFDMLIVIDGYGIRPNQGGFSFCPHCERLSREYHYIRTEPASNILDALDELLRSH